MKTTKNSKKNETRVLIASLSIAAVAVAGATFAWFTSKDEVTNRLSASAAYDVSIAEDLHRLRTGFPVRLLTRMLA